MSQIDPDPLQAARKIAIILCCLLDPDDGRMLATKAAERGEPWLYEGWRRRHGEDLADVLPFHRPSSGDEP